LSPGGHEWAPEWNTNPTGVAVEVHLLDEGKGMAARRVTPLFQGGAFSTTNDSDRPPVDVEVPADAKEVEVVWLATGHGGDTYNCTEFCEHAHAFTVSCSATLMGSEPIDGVGSAESYSRLVVSW
jgi:Peptide-N-glycosidase F, C terminal